MPSVNSATPSGSSQLPTSLVSPGTGTLRVRMYPAAARTQTSPLNAHAAEDKAGRWWLFLAAGSARRGRTILLSVPWG